MSLSHASCERCGYETSVTPHLGACPHCKGLFLIEYNIEEIKERGYQAGGNECVSRLWNFADFLPTIDLDERVTLGEGGTHLHRSKGLAMALGLRNLYLKDETTNPTGSFLDRGTAVEISGLKQTGVDSVLCASTGNLAASVVAYAARAGMECSVYIPSRGNVDVGKLYQILAYAADVITSSDYVHAAKRAIKGKKADRNIKSSNTYFLEGIKTIAFEIIEDMNWEAPDWMILPMGSGGNLSMTYRGLLQLAQAGLIENMKTRMVGVQAKGCSPIVDAFQKNTEIAPAPSVSTIAIDIGIKNPSCGSLALDTLKHSNGLALSVSDKDILDAVRMLAKTEGIFAEPASAAAIAGLKHLVESGSIDSTDSVVCTITSTGLKYPEIAKSFVNDRDDLKYIIRRVEGPRFTIKLGKTKVLVMQILYSGESYGYGIWKTLKNEYDVEISIPSVYQHLNDLRDNGLIAKTREKETIRRTTRVYYALTEKGRSLLTQLETIS